MSYHGDVRLGDTIDVKFTTRQSTGAPTTLAGSPAVAAYVGNSTTEITAGITLTVDFDSRTGLNNVRVVASSGNGFATATNIELVLTAGTVNSVSVVSEVVGSFSIENRSALMPTTAGRTVVVDSAGLVDANAVKAGPTGSGTAQTARDLGNALPAAAPNASGGLITNGTGAGQLSPDGHGFVYVSSGTGANQISLAGGKAAATIATGDDADAATLLARLTATRAGYLDNLNVGGAVASHADVLAINTSSSKHLILTTVGQYERPESGTVTYTIEARTFSAADGSAVNADSTPTLTATGIVSGSLAGNLSAATNPATGVYRWTYTVLAAATLEQVRFDVSATISSSTFTLSAYSQVADFVASTWTAADRANLGTILTDVTALFNVCPANTPAVNADGSMQADLVAIGEDAGAAGRLGAIANGSLTVKATDGSGGAIPTAATNAAAVWAAGTRTLTSFAYTVTLADGSLTAAKFAADAITAAAMSAAAANKLADHGRRRTQANVEASADGDALSTHSLYGMIQQGQNSSESGATWTVKKTDGTTLGTFTLVSTPGADPTTGVS